MNSLIKITTKVVCVKIKTYVRWYYKCCYCHIHSYFQLCINKLYYFWKNKYILHILSLKHGQKLSHDYHIKYKLLDNNSNNNIYIAVPSSINNNVNIFHIYLILNSKKCFSNHVTNHIYMYNPNNNKYKKVNYKINSQEENIIYTMINRQFKW